MEKDLISVVVPIYKVEQYLHRCVDSIINQTYRNLEVILVDDGSPDHCGAICDEYASRDTRIKVIHQANKGLSGARNTGIDFFHGDYLLFIDSDDFIEPQMIELLHRMLEHSDATLSMVLPLQVDESYSSTKGSIDLESVTTLELGQDELMRGLLGLPSRLDITTLHVAWNKLYPRKLVEGNYFAQVSNEDLEYNSRIFLRTEKVVCVMARMYNYIQRSTSIIHESFNEKQIKKLKTVHTIYQNIKSNKTFEAYCLDYLYKAMLNIRHKSQGTPYETRVKTECKHLKDDTIKAFLNNKTLPFYRKAGLLSLYYMPFLYRFIIWGGETVTKYRKSHA